MFAEPRSKNTPVSNWFSLIRPLFKYCLVDFPFAWQLIKSLQTNFEGRFEKQVLFRIIWAEEKEGLFINGQFYVLEISLLLGLWNFVLYIFSFSIVLKICKNKTTVVKKYFHTYLTYIPDGVPKAANWFFVTNVPARFARGVFKETWAGSSSQRSLEVMSGSVSCAIPNRLFCSHLFKNTCSCSILVLSSLSSLVLQVFEH
jgi:hypothetical protein